MRFRAEQRLRRQHDFRAAREKGRRIDCGAFTAWFYRRRDPEGDPPTLARRRVGVVASTAAVGIAVQRNRAKRRLRSIFRHHQDSVPAGYDVLLVARAAVNRLDYSEIEKRFIDACRKL